MISRQRVVEVANNAGSRLASWTPIERNLAVICAVSPLVMSWVDPHRMLLSAGAENSDDLAVLKDLIESGKVTPVIDKTFGLEETPEAVGHVGERHTRGKTVITVAAAD